MPWRDQLGRMLGQHRKPPDSRWSREEVRRFLRETVAPALGAVAHELARHGRDADVEAGPDLVSITVYDGDEEEFYYAVKARSFRQPTFAFPEMTFRDDDEDLHHRAMVYTREGAQNYGIMGYEKDQVTANFLHEYDRQLRWQRPSKRGS